MGKAGRWLKHLITGAREKNKPESRAHAFPSETHSGPISAPGTEKKRWSFRRPAATEKVLCPSEQQINGRGGFSPGSEADRRRHAMAIAAATTAAALAAAQAATTIMMHLTTSADAGRASSVEEAAAIKIQAAFRSYLARKALLALKGLVKLQALVRGRLVRMQTTATLRSMQALIRVQARTQQHKTRMLGESARGISHQHPGDRRTSSSSQYRHRHRQPYETDKWTEENVKIVEMDIGEAAKPRKKLGHGTTHAYGSSMRQPSKVDNQQTLQQQQILPTPLPAACDISIRTYSGRLGECSYNTGCTAQDSPQYSPGANSMYDGIRKPSFFTSRRSHDYCCHYSGFFPNYMANTESSRAKVRSRSAPKQRSDDAWEGSQPLSRRTSLELEGRSIPISGYGMQRSSSHAKPAAAINLYPAGTCIKLDRSKMSQGTVVSH